ncbi:unnamed protein product [Hermetia illucens]|uniref:Uncharacterized protein n=1 Tax=Hermetia illucens TaxID=343691 RepID=A0A7R8V3C2_HERIL|nr:unnamed protein product [Hermetia illucens]
MKLLTPIHPHLRFEGITTRPSSILDQISSSLWVMHRLRSHKLHLLHRERRKNRNAKPAAPALKPKKRVINAFWKRESPTAAI